MPLLDWLEQCALPEECKLADRAYARAVAGEFIDGLVAPGTTSALVFGSHFAPAMDELFTAAERRGLNITAGLVLSDRILRPDLLHSPGDGAGGQRRPDPALARPRPAALRGHAAVLAVNLGRDARRLRAAARRGTSGSPRTSTRTWPKSRPWPGCSPGRGTTWTPTAGTAWSPPAACSRTTCTPSDAELALLAEPAPGSRTARPATRPWAAVFSRCAGTWSTGSVSRSAPTWAPGTGLFLPKEALQAYFIQQLLGPAGLSLTPVHLLYLATRAGARALGLGGPGRRPRGRQGLRRGLAAPGRREHAGGQPASRPRHLRRAGQDLRPGHPGGRGRGVDPRRARRRSPDQVAARRQKLSPSRIGTLRSFVRNMATRGYDAADELFGQADRITQQIMLKASRPAPFAIGKIRSSPERGRTPRTEQRARPHHDWTTRPPS